MIYNEKSQKKEEPKKTISGGFFMFGFFGFLGWVPTLLLFKKNDKCIILTLTPCRIYKKRGNNACLGSSFSILILSSIGGFWTDISKCSEGGRGKTFFFIGASEQKGLQSQEFSGRVPKDNFE